MIQKIKTSIEFTKNLLVTGAITETSKKVESEICRFLPKGENKVIVEYGMGHGNITRNILANISPSSRLYSFEVNKEFCEHVGKTIHDERLIIINDSAENLKNHLHENIHSVISSIPFSFLTTRKGLEIIKNSYDLLDDNTYFSQVLYTKFNFKKFQFVFEKCQMIKLFNIPMEYIYHCQKFK